jgi:diguanylate cyclase (GGDEF)-like protein/PAS domain S-box-containing protein
VLSTDLLPEPAIVLDANGAVTSANSAAEACFGGPVQGRSVGELVTRPDALMGPLTAAADGEVWRAELEGRRADGVPFPLDASGRVVAEGPPRVALVLLRDRNADGGVGLLSRRHFDFAFDVSPIGMAVYDTDGRFVRVNDAMCRLLGRARADLIGTRDQELTHPDDRDTDLAYAERILAGEIDHCQIEKRFVLPDGKPVWAIANMSFMRDAGGRPIAWLGQFQDITEHRRMAERDALTDIFNRRRFEEVLSERLVHGARYAPPGALIVFDLDGFKEVNDRLGHAAGDTVLQDVARAVQTRVRESDVLARLGGDEFAVILPHATGMEAQIVGRAIVELVRDLPHGVTASVGVAPFAEGRADPEPVLAAADAALYEVKRTGGNGFALREPGAEPEPEPA